RQIATARDDFAEALRDQGWEVPEAQATFVWLPLGSLSSAFEDACVERAVAVRNLGEVARISIGEPEALSRVLEIAQAFRAERFGCGRCGRDRSAGVRRVRGPWPRPEPPRLGRGRDRAASRSWPSGPARCAGGCRVRRRSAPGLPRR